METDKLILKLTWKYTGVKIAHSLLKMKHKVGVFVLLETQYDYKATIIKNSCTEQG